LMDAFLARFSPTGDLLFSSYLGGTGDFGEFGDFEGIEAIAVGSNGDVYLVGETSSADFPTINALQPKGSGGLFVARFNPASNNLVFSTYLGGVGGLNGPYGLALDAANNVYLYATGGADFPTTSDALKTALGQGESSDAVLSVLSFDNSHLVYSSYLGSKGQPSGVALDHSGNIYLSGKTKYVTEFAVQNPIVPNPFTGRNAAFVVKFSPIVSTLPLMHITRSGNTVTISWPVSAVGFNLEVSNSLAPAPNWSPELNAPLIVADQNAVTIEIGSSPKFFRLRK